MKEISKKDQIEIDQLERQIQYLEQMLDIVETNSKKQKEFLESITPSAPTMGNVPLILSLLFLGIAIIEKFN